MMIKRKKSLVASLIYSRKISICEYVMFLFLLLFSLSCSLLEEKKMPDDILPKDKMVSVLVEVHLAEAGIALKSLVRDTAVKINDRYLKVILKEKGVNENEFRRSFKYYEEDPKLFDDLYTTIIDSLSLRQARGKL